MELLSQDRLLTLSCIVKIQLIYLLILFQTRLADFFTKLVIWLALRALNITMV